MLQFGSEFVQLCSDIALKAVRLDRHRLDSARTYTKNEKETDAAAASLSQIGQLISKLYQHHWQMNLVCALQPTWHRVILCCQAKVTG